MEETRKPTFWELLFGTANNLGTNADFLGWVSGKPTEEENNQDLSKFTVTAKETNPNMTIVYILLVVVVIFAAISIFRK